MKKILLCLVMLLMISGCGKKELPAPQLDSGMRGELGIDKNINETTIDDYLFRDDIVYRDMRMLKDEADYEAIGGDSDLSGIVEGFEVVPFPYICNVTGLPQEVGETYQGDTLFTKKDDIYVANYEESLSILETLFPKDKIIFLMCGGGGYAGMTKQLLISQGYDADRIYNVGGYWYYQGKHDLKVKDEKDGVVSFDFSKFIYHEISFDSLTRITPREEVDPLASIEHPYQEISIDTYLDKIENNESFLLYVNLKGCSGCAEFRPILDSYIEKSGAEVFAISINDLDHPDNPYAGQIAYTPSLAIYENGTLKAFLDSGSDEDYEIFHDADLLASWVISQTK